MSSRTNNYSQGLGYRQETAYKQNNKKPWQPYLIGLIIFVILAILLVILILWWYLWRDPDNLLLRACTASSQCLPNEICNNGYCNAVPCTLNSECSVVSGGNNVAYCVKGYCQTATCNSNTDCNITGGTQVCTHFTPNVATPWINSACVNTGTTCSSNNDCYGGDIGLVCVKQSGQTTGVCSQCGTSSDCGTGQICLQGVCSECTSSDQCTTGTCNSGLCCTNPAYMVNGNPSCVQGDNYDICVSNTDCKSGKCIDLGNQVKVCGGGTQGNMLFSAGTIVNVGDPDTVAKYTCTAPVDPNDTTAKPFAVDGVCTYYSALDSNTGSACGRPSYCNKSSKLSNLLCNGNVIVSNPFATACSSNNDCTATLGAGYGCSNAGYCSKTCGNNTNCPAGFVCGSNKVCQYPPSKIVCTYNACTSESTCECPSGYICNAKKGSTGNCVWENTGTTDEPTTPPAPFVINSVCSRPATALPSGGDAIATSGYCVNGFCSTDAGWINSICRQDGDCLYIEGNTSTNLRTSFVCTNIGTYSVCRGGVANSISR